MIRYKNIKSSPTYMRLFIQQAKIHSITLFPLPDNPMQIVEVREPLEKEESVGDK